MGVKFANNAYGTLNAGITNSATSLTLSSGQGARFPSLGANDFFYATLIDTSNNLEVVKCTARSTDVLTITRAQESTTARAFAVGDRVELRVTAAGLEDNLDNTDIDTILPDQSSANGYYLTSDGTNASWVDGSVGPDDVSGANNTATSYFSIPQGTSAQRTGTNAGSLRWNSDRRTTEQYISLAGTGTNGYFSAGGTGTLVAHYSTNSSWSSLDIDFVNGSTAGNDYHMYLLRAVIVETDSATTANLRAQFLNLAGSPLTGSNYRGGTSFATTNDGFDGTVQLTSSSYMPITLDSGYSDSNYFWRRNGEGHCCLELLISNVMGHSSTVNRRQLQGHCTYDTANGFQYSRIYGQLTSADSPVTHVNGENYYPIGGIRFNCTDEITASGNSGTNTRISVWGITGMEADRN